MAARDLWENDENGLRLLHQKEKLILYLLIQDREQAEPCQIQIQNLELTEKPTRVQQLQMKLLTPMMLYPIIYSQTSSILHLNMET